MDAARPGTIDAHLHLWRIGAAWHGWPTHADAALYRDFTPDDARAAMAESGIDAAIVVQAQTDDRETDWLLDLAATDPLVAGVVDWVALDRADAPARIATLAARGGLVGLRPMLQSIPDDDWLLRDAVAPAIAAMVDHGLCLDALVRPRHLPMLARFADCWPTLTIVVDHAAKPSTAPPAGWAEDLAALAERPNLWCKLSGLRTEQPPGESPDALAPIAAHVLARFGDRAIWGSDWPVLHDAGDRYADWLAITRTLTAHLSATARARLMRGAARACYGV